jgi:PilZ domain.
MPIEQRRAERIADFLPIEIRAVHIPDGRELAGPFSGRILDISLHGAGLLMTQVMIHRFHVFHSTNTAENTALQLIIDRPPDIDRHVLIARPVWINTFRHHKIKAFKMGVEFIEIQEKEQMLKLLAALRKDQEARSIWWQERVQT